MVRVIERLAADGEKVGAFGGTGIELHREGQERFGADRVLHTRGEFLGGLNYFELNLSRRQRSGSIDE